MQVLDSVQLSFLCITTIPNTTKRYALNKSWVLTVTTTHAILYGSDQAEYTQESQLTGDESKCHRIRKICADGNKLCPGKEWRQ